MKWSVLRESCLNKIRISTKKVRILYFLKWLKGFKYEVVIRLHGRKFEKAVHFYMVDLTSVVYQWIFFISLFFKSSKVALAISLFPLSQFKVTCSL